jgi:hypothetical protein
MMMIPTASRLPFFFSSTPSLLDANKHVQEICPRDEREKNRDKGSSTDCKIEVEAFGNY